METAPELEPGDHLREELRRILTEAKTVAVIGASADDHKAAHVIPRYLKEQGYTIIPVNPRGGEILGERVAHSLSEVDVRVDVVEVFRPPAEAEGVARQAIAAGAKILWFQPGTHTDEAIRLASEAGLVVVARRCMGVTHGRLGLGPGPKNPATAEEDERRTA